MVQKFFAFILITILINACCTSNKSTQLKDNSSLYKNIAESKLGKSSIINVNPDSTYFAAYTSGKSSGDELNKPLKFFIYDTKEEKIIFEDNLSNGKIEWINENQIKVSTIPGIVSGKEEKNKKLFGYIFDVKQKRKIYPDKELDINK